MANMIDRAELEQSPDFWWLRFRFALRDGDHAGVAEAQQRLSDLGVNVQLHAASDKEAAS